MLVENTTSGSGTKDHYPLYLTTVHFYFTELTIYRIFINKNMIKLVFGSSKDCIVK